MVINFYNFSKRTNSTMRPTSGETQLPCQLKDPCGMLTPTFIIHNVPAAIAPVWSYAYVPSFKRYYFINDWRWLNGVWECACAVDVLASFKTEIGNLAEYVTRSSYEFDGNIVDDMYICKTEIATQLTQLPEFYVRVMTAGFYVVGIIGKESTATQGAITYYQMTPAEMARLRAYLLSDTFLSDQGLTQLTDFIPADATKVIYNPYQYIVSCKWFPFPSSAIPDAFKTAVSTIDFGWWNTGTGFSAYRIKDMVPVYTRSENISLQDHPQASNRGEFLNHAPYTSRVLRMTPFNEVQIPDEYLSSGDHLTVELQCDFITGMGALLLHARTGENIEKMLITRMTSMLGVDIQLAQVGTDYLGARTQELVDKAALWNGVSGAITNIDVSSALGAATSAFQSGAQIAQAKTMYDVGGLNNYLKAKAPQLLTSGSNGSLLLFAQNNYLCQTFYRLVSEDRQQLGRPLCAVRILKNIPGYILCRNADVNISCFEQERSLIGQFLVTGFFYE